jgi:autotransporter-associated beta strand protein
MSKLQQTSFEMNKKSMQKVAALALAALAPAAYAGTPIEADLLASYTATYAASVGGEDNAQVILANTVAGSNAIQDQDGTGAHMRIAGFYQSANDVTGQTSTGGIVNWLSSSDSHLIDVVTQGAALGADLVVYVCSNTDYSSIAGVSQQPGMYSSLNPSSVWSAVFAHETGGHAYGRAHNDGLLSPKTIMLHNYCGGGAAPPYFYSNPNIWFNGVQLLGDGVNNCSMGSLVNGGDNSSCSAQAVADRRARVIAGPDLSHVVLRWMFTNAPGSAPAGVTNNDLVSGAPAVVRGNGAMYTGRSLRIPGGTTGNVAMSGMSAYIDLPNNILSTQTNITIEIWATPLSAPNWARLLDFGRCTQSGDGLGAAGEYTGAASDPAPGTTSSYDGITLSVVVNTNLTQQRFEAKLAGYATTLDAGLATTAGVQHHYAIVFTDGAGGAGSAGGRWQWFRDGDPVAYLDVTNHLSALSDVNNWLGRSQWSADSLANNEYAEVRISTVALTRAQIVANFLLGPNYSSGATVMLTNSDASGATSFNAAGQWSSGAAPSAGNSYETFDFQLRTPAASGSYAFGGDSLRMSGGALLWKGTGSGSVTVSSLALNNGTVVNGGSGTCILAGAVAVSTNGGVFNAENGPISVTAALSGAGPLTFESNAVTLAGNNSAYTGKLCVGNGMPGGLVIDSQARLGASPAVFTADQLDLNRGALQTTASFALDDVNRGITLDVSGGIFNVASGTTLTLSSTLSSPPTASGVIVGSLTKTGFGTLVLNSPGNAFKGTLYVDSGSSTANDGVVTVSNNQVLAAAHSPIYIRNNNSGSSRLQLDGTRGGIALPQAVVVSARTVSTVAIENVAGTNTIAGGLALGAGGSYYLVQSDANSVLNLGGTISSAATGSRTLTLQGAGSFGVAASLADGSGTMNLAKSGTGAATLSGNSTYSGATSVNQGTLRLQPSTAVLHLTFDNAAGSSGGSVITNSGSGGGAMNGVIVGSGATIVSGGRYGNALSVNGAGSTGATNIVLISSKVLDTSSNASWTVAFWIKTTTAGAVIMYQGDGTWSSSGQTTYLLNANSGSTAGTKAGAVRWAGGFLTGTTALNNGAWHFITLVDNAGAEKIYVDGNVDAVTSTMGLGLAGGANQVWIGGAPDTDAGAVKMNGLIDEVYMFNRALSAAEVLALVNSNNPASATAPVLPVATAVSVGSGATLDVGGMTQTVAFLAGSGTVTNSAAGTAMLTISNAGSTATFAGTLTDSSAASALSLAQAGNATNILSGANSYRGATFVNGGALYVNGTGGSGLTTVGAGTLLGGSGVLAGSLTVQSGGTVSPGNGIGKLTVNGSATLQPGSTTVMELNRASLAGDQLLVGGALTYGGTLVVTNLGGTFAGGDAFALFRAGAINGSFTSTTLPPLNPGLAWNTAALAGGLLTVVQTAPTNLLWTVNGASLSLSWPSDRVGWRLLVQTNNLARGVSADPNDWATVAFSGQTNLVVLPIDPALPQEFYRLVYP